jgi:hypothetical protein
MKTISLLAGFILTASLSLSAFGEQPVRKIPDRKTLLKIERHNLAQRNASKLALTAEVARPFSDYAQTKYVVLTNGSPFDSIRVKTAVLKNLPAGTEAVVLAPVSGVSRARDFFNDFISDDRLHVVGVANVSQAFWARDALPVPAFLPDGKLAVVDARYYNGFPQDQAIADLFSATLVSHNYYHEGGNFQSDESGRCLIVNNERAARIPDDAFAGYYGCKKVIRLKHVRGIGHVDEVVRLVGDNKLLTPVAEYKTILEKAGYQVAMLPSPKTPYGTYANSLLVNGTAFLPVYKESTDNKAISVYKSFGFTVVPVETRSLSKDGLGSIHCITMQYPETPLNELVKALQTAF